MLRTTVLTAEPSENRRSESQLIQAVNKLKHLMCTVIYAVATENVSGVNSTHHKCGFLS